MQREPTTAGSGTVDTSVERVREVLIAATDIIAPGEEPYVGWSLVLAERIVAALEDA